MNIKLCANPNNAINAVAAIIRRKGFIFLHGHRLAPGSL